MLTRLANGVWIRLRDVKAIKVEEFPRSEMWSVHITHGDAMLTMTETCEFDSDLGAHRYADELGAKVAEQQREASGPDPDEARRQRTLDRAAWVAAGILAGEPQLGVIQSIRLALDAIAEALPDPVIP